MQSSNEYADGNLGAGNLGDVAAWRIYLMKTLKEKIEIMQAALDGEEIEVYSTRGDDWVKTNVPVWNWDNYDYRIKPKPLEFWVNIYSDSVLGYTTEKEAKGHATASATQIKVREITDDE